MKTFAIIVAGGSGSRMKTKIPKQFMEIDGTPILMHTIRKFLSLSPAPQVVLVLPSHEFKKWYELCDKHDFYELVQLVPGGASRFDSVKNGLKAIKSSDGLVAVHDGVRPFVSESIIQKSYEVAAQTGAAVACILPKDSVRQTTNDTDSQALDRAAVRLVQTPQTFELNLMRSAFDTPARPEFTDCASVLEAAGHAVTLIEGSYDNIKITTPDDLAWANIIVSKVAVQITPEGDL